MCAHVCERERQNEYEMREKGVREIQTEHMCMKTSARLRTAQ